MDRPAPGLTPGCYHQSAQHTVQTVEFVFNRGKRETPEEQARGRRTQLRTATLTTATACLPNTSSSPWSGLTFSKGKTVLEESPQTAPRTSLVMVRTSRFACATNLYLGRVWGVRRQTTFSIQTLAVLAALADRPAAWRHGYDLARETGLKSGTLYPILVRLADRRVVEACWEEGQPAGRPRRHLYRLTSEGLAIAMAALSAAQVDPAVSARPVRSRSADAPRRAPRPRPVAAEDL